MGRTLAFLLLCCAAVAWSAHFEDNPSESNEDAWIETQSIPKAIALVEMTGPGFEMPCLPIPKDPDAKKLVDDLLKERKKAGSPNGASCQLLQMAEYNDAVKGVLRMMLKFMNTKSFGG